MNKDLFIKYNMEQQQKLWIFLLLQNSKNGHNNIIRFLNHMIISSMSFELLKRFHGIFNRNKNRMDVANNR